MELSNFVRQVTSFSAKSHSDKAKLFGWYLHTYGGKTRFTAADIRGCYDATHLDLPANANRTLEALTEKRPPELLRDRDGYRLSQHTREHLDRTLGQSESYVRIEKMLTELPSSLADECERLFLAEALTCYRNGAFRAAVVMTWNLAYDHLVRWVLADPQRLAAFNAGISRRNPKKASVTIAKREDFDELKEDETVDIAAGLPGFSANVKRILKEKLGRRNTYAHPSTLRIERAQVDDMITDLTNNVVNNLKL